MVDAEIVPAEDKKQLARQRLEAYNDYRSLMSSLRNHTLTFLQIGMLLKKIRDNKEYKYLGEGGYDSFTDFINNPEIGLREPSTLYLYIDAFETYMERMKMTQEEILSIPLTRLQRLLPSVKRTIKADESKIEEVKEMVISMGTMTNTDFDKEAREKKIVSEKPRLFQNKETGKWVLECYTVDIARIVVKFRSKDSSREDNEKAIKSKIEFIDISNYEDKNE